VQRGKSVRIFLECGIFVYCETEKKSRAFFIALVSGYIIVRKGGDKKKRIKAYG